MIRFREVVLIGALVIAAPWDAQACALYNATDASVRVLAADGVTVAELGGRSANLYLGGLAEATVLSGAEAVTLPCASGSAFVLDPHGAVRRLPRWFSVENRGDRILVTAPEKTVVRIDGIEHESSGTIEVVYDTATIAMGSIETLHAAHIEIPKAKVDVWIDIDKAQLLARELARVDKAPLAWSSLHAGPGPHPMLVLTCDMGAIGGAQCRRGGTVRGLNELDRIGAAQLVAVVVHGSVPVETCRRSGIRRRLARARVTIYEALTGHEVIGRDFFGSEPPACPDTAGPSADLVGTSPPADAIDAWLGEH